MMSCDDDDDDVSEEDSEDDDRGCWKKVFVLHLSSVQPKTSKQPFSSRQGIVSFLQKISKSKVYNKWERNQK